MKTDYKETIQQNVVEYLRTGNTEAAGAAFELLKTHEWKRKSFRTAFKIYGTTDDAVSLYALKFMDALRHYDESKGDFVNFVNRAITNGVINAGTKNKRIRDHEVEYAFGESEKPNDEVDDSPEEKFAADQPDVHDQAFDMTPGEKQRIMREIIRDIVEKATEEEVAILLAYAETGSMREVAERFDTHKVKVMRTLDRMKKYYDADKFGDVEQYFTTNTKKSRGGRKS